ncbi:DNA polymerase III subunit gamma/tau [Petrocella atlantisensis]|uniref:DNA-directed DNA polymerase n=1 Tax=Petrocella atlantisensis TaxID=2173034 RepID=A0A3P7PFI0_9FIRM|nr:DNA polymerase III subunit gamma/tau [Petrocella atlantisensis]VDN47658.1 DNA polymerase III subunit gamma/tau [Petrocella atlantisensis]
MAYTALYRKWRPRSFKDLVGQDHIVKTLTNQIMSQRVTHAYLLCGTRGTGKTSTAKIFAQAINCDEPIEGNPCHRCPSCMDIEEKGSMNIIEIDAASNNGVDNIRDIRDEVKYTPTLGKYKVYIIDEVHMLSTGAFNALLKTLEEPPKHVIFILATTEPHKIPATVLSRCQRYDFKRITIETITGALKSYMVQENITIEEKAINYIAKVANGSMRDALSILDQCIAFYIGEDVTLEKVLDVLGAVDHEVFAQLTDALLDRNAKACMDIVEKITMQGRDILQFILDTVNHLRNLLVVKSVDEPDEILDMTMDQILLLKTQSIRFKEETILYYIKQLSNLENKIKYMSGERILLEVELLKLCNPDMDDTNEGLRHRLTYLEETVKKGIMVHETLPEKQTSKEAPKKSLQKVIDIDAVPEDIKQVIHNWKGVVEHTHTVTKAFLKSAFPINLEDDVVYIVCDSEIGKNHLSQEENMGKIDHVLKQMFDKKFNIKVIDQEDYNQITQRQMSKDESLKDAKNVYEQIKSKINFDIEIR